MSWRPFGAGVERRGSSRIGIETARLRLRAAGVEIATEWTGLVGSETDTPRPLGRIVRKGWTEEKSGLFEHREIVAAHADCPGCGRAIECLADTDGWFETYPGSKVWRHESYGPPMGECSKCELLLAETEPGSPHLVVFDRAAPPRTNDAPR